MIRHSDRYTRHDRLRAQCATTGRGAWSPRSVALAVALLLAPLAVAGPNREVTDANALYAMGQYQEALDIYTRLAKEDPENARLQFNQGAAQFQLGDLDAAKAAFQSAGQQSDNPRLQALAAYNLGNCAVQEAQAEAAENPEEAMKKLFTGVDHYKDALAKDGNLSEAANNLEMAKRVIQQLRQQQQQQQEQEQEQQQQKDDAKKALDELAKEQEEQRQKSDKAAEEQQDPNQPDPGKDQMDQQADDQQATREKTEALSDKMESQQDGGEDSPMDEAKEHADEAAKKQKEAEEHLRNQDPKKAEEAQEAARDELQKARDALDKDEKSEEEKSEESADKDKGDESKDKSESEEQEKADEDKPEGAGQNPQDQQAERGEEVPPPDTDARDILNQEKRNKEERNLRRMIRIRPVDKDW